MRDSLLFTVLVVFITGLAVWIAGSMTLDVVRTVAAGIAAAGG